MPDLKVSISQNDKTLEPTKRKLLGVRHLQCLLLFVSLLIFYGQRTTMSVAIIAMTDETPPDPDIPTYPEWKSTDTVLSSFFWGYMVTQLGAGQLSELFGPKWFLFGTMIVGSIFHILIPMMAANFGTTGVIICRIVQGLNQGFLYPSIHNLLSRWTPLNERSSIACIVYGGSSVGIIVSMLFTGAISGSVYGWPLAFYIYGACGIFWAIILVIFGANSPSVHRSISIEEKEYIESTNFCSNEAKEKVPTPWKAILTSLPVWSLLAICCGQSWGGFTLLTEIPNYMSNIMNFDINSNSQLSSLPYLALFILNLVNAPIADKLISNKILTIGATRKIFTLIGTLLPATALFCLGLIDSSQDTLATILLVLAVGSSSFNLAGCLVNPIDLAPNHAGTIMGLTNGTSIIFAILGPLTVEFLGSDKKDPILWRKVFWLAGGIYVGCGLFFALFSSGDVQKWNTIESDEDKNESKCDKINDKDKILV